MSSAPPPAGWFAFPFGEAVLQLRAIPGPADVDIACSVHDGHGQQIGLIRPRTRVPAVLARETATLTFDLLRPTGAVVLTFTRIGGATKGHRLVVADGGGGAIGQLRQTSSYWRLFRTSRLDIALEAGSQAVGSTAVCVRPDDPFPVVETPVNDPSGAVIGVVERRWRYADGSTDFFDYALNCPRPLAAPLPELLVATVFAHYLYDRLAVGGPLEGMNRFGRGPGRW